MTKAENLKTSVEESDEGGAEAKQEKQEKKFNFRELGDKVKNFFRKKTERIKVKVAAASERIIGKELRSEFHTQISKVTENWEEIMEGMEFDVKRLMEEYKSLPTHTVVATEDPFKDQREEAGHKKGPGYVIKDRPRQGPGYVLQGKGGFQEA